MFKLDLEKAEEPEIKLPSSTGSQRKQGNSRKTYTFASLSTLNSLIVWMKTNCGKFLKRWENQSILPTSWETCLQVKKQQLELDMKQWNGSKSWKEFMKAVYCHPAYLTCMQSISCEMLGWMKHKLESRLPGRYQQPQIFRWYHANGRVWRGTKDPLDEGEWEEWNTWLKTQHSKKWRSWPLVPSLHGKYVGKRWKQWQTLYPQIPKSLQMVTAAMKLKDAYSLEGKL